MTTSPSDPLPQTGSGKSQKTPREEGSGPGSSEKQGGDDIIVFYCPSGHKLNAPSRLQGKPGQCPHCGEKFRIPSYEEDQIEEAVEEIAEDEPAAAGAPPGQLTDIEDIEEFPETHEEIEEIQDEIVDIDVEADIEELPVAAEAGGLPGFVGPGHALAQVFSRLWNRRGEEGTVDVYLAEGELLSPEFFSPQLSQTTHAVFADLMDDGTYTVTSVPWDSVTRAVLKKVDGLPDGLFH
jgi:hypothetical protein